MSTAAQTAFAEECKDLYQRHSTYEIARLLSCSQGKVVRALRKGGVNRRSPKEAMDFHWQGRV